MTSARSTLAIVELYGRSRGLWLTVLLAGPVLIVGCGLLPRSVPLMLSDLQQRLRLPALVGLAVALAFAPTFARGLSEAEWLHRSRIRVARTLHVAVASVVLMAVALSVAGSAVPSALSWEVSCNGLALLGLLLWTVAATPWPPWLLPLTVAAATYVLGTNADDGTPHRWAWLLWTTHIGLKYSIDAALFVIGAGAFIVRQGRVRTDAE